MGQLALLFIFSGVTEKQNQKQKCRLHLYPECIPDSGLWGTAAICRERKTAQEKLSLQSTISDTEELSSSKCQAYTDEQHHISLLGPVEMKCRRSREGGVGGRHFCRKL